jgi:hypothetical protein
MEVNMVDRLPPVGITVEDETEPGVVDLSLMSDLTGHQNQSSHEISLSICQIE